MKKDDLRGITTSGLSYITLSVASMREGSCVPELLSLLTPQQLLSLVEVYGGKAIKLPTPKQFSQDMMCGLYIYNKMLNPRLSLEKYVADLGLLPSEKVKINETFVKWRDHVAELQPELVALLGRDVADE